MNARILIFSLVDHFNSIIHYAHNIDMYTYTCTSCGGCFCVCNIFMSMSINIISNACMHVHVHVERVYLGGVH